MTEQDAEYWHERWRFAWEMVDKVGNESVAAHMRVINLRTALILLIEEHRGRTGPSIKAEFADGTVVTTDDLVPQPAAVPIERLERILAADRDGGWSVDDGAELRRRMEELRDWAAGRGYDDVERRIRTAMLDDRDVALPEGEGT